MNKVPITLSFMLKLGFVAGVCYIGYMAWQTYDLFTILSYGSIPTIVVAAFFYYRFLDNQESLGGEFN